MFSHLTPKKPHENESSFFGNSSVMSHLHFANLQKLGTYMHEQRPKAPLSLVESIHARAFSGSVSPVLRSSILVSEEHQTDILVRLTCLHAFKKISFF